MGTIRRSMVATDAQETLEDLIDEITIALEELQESEMNNQLGLYGEGEKAAYVHMLGFIQQRWKDSEKFGLDYDIERRFPV